MSQPPNAALAAAADTTRQDFANRQVTILRGGATGPAAIVFKGTPAQCRAFMRNRRTSVPDDIQ